MGNEPHRFVMEHSEKDLKDFDGFVHRTFQAEDLKHFIRSLRNMYSEWDSLEDVFLSGIKEGDSNMKHSIHHFKQEFFSIPHEKRTQKHVADPLNGSSAKRINMYLRWMVRPNDRGVDFGIWKRIPTSILSCPLDVHSGRNARQLGLLLRTQNDWKAVEELDASLRKLDAQDPVKYDYALFGLGVYQLSGHRIPQEPKPEPDKHHSDHLVSSTQHVGLKQVFELIGKHHLQTIGGQYSEKRST